MSDTRKKEMSSSDILKPANNTEKVMIWLAVITILISVVSQAGSIVTNLLQFNSIYKQLYPLLNIFHLYVLFYMIFELQKIKTLIPSAAFKEDKEKYPAFREKLKQWIKEHFGEIYWKEWKKEEKDKKKAIKAKDDNFNKYIDKLVINTNKNITNTHTYFLGFFVCFLLLYIFELINSFTPTVSEPVLHILTIIFNNIATLFLFYVYLTLNVPKTTRKIYRENREEEKRKFSYIRNKILHRIWNFFSFASIFGYPDKYERYENPQKDKNGKYESLEISKINLWGLIGVLVLVITTIGFIYFIFYFQGDVLDIEHHYKGDNKDWYYYSFRILSTFSILLGGCAMLSIFSRLSGGFRKIPLNAFLIMLFYAAVQPLFFAGEEFSAANMKMGQMMFIANLLCLIGKFGLLHLIKWFFAGHHIAYYFIAEQIINDKNKGDKLKLDELFMEVEYDKK